MTRPRAAKMARTDRFDSGDLTRKLCVRSDLRVSEAADETVAFQSDEQLLKSL